MVQVILFGDNIVVHCIMYHCLFNQSAINGYLDCFQSFAVKKNAATFVHTSLYVCTTVNS